MGRSAEHVTPFAAQFPATTIARARPRLGGLHLSERRLLLLVGDVTFLSLALLGALWLRFSVLGEANEPFFVRWYWWAVLLALWFPLAIIARCYDLRRVGQSLESAVRATIMAGGVSALYLVVPIVSAPLTRSRLAWFIFALLAMLGMGLWRIVYVGLMRQSVLSRRALVIGAGDAGRVLVETIDGLGPTAGVEVLGFVDDRPTMQGRRIAGRAVLGTYDDLVSLASRLRADELVVAVTEAGEVSGAFLSLLERCWGHGISVRPVQLYFEEITGAVMVQHIGPNLFVLMNGQDACYQRLWGAARRLIDIVVGIVGSLALAPLIPFIALAIYLDSPGPIFYWQQRVGRRGELFWLAKFRSMVPNAERDGAVWAANDDKRITRVGRWLRKTRIDELPQLWNLLTGSMTLIGPRPERPEFVRQLDKVLPYYGIRHSVKPGLTGWAQVRYRYGSNVDDALLKLQYDLYYLKHRGPVLDLLIALETVRVILAMEGI